MIRKLLPSTLFLIFCTFSHTLSAQCWTNVWPGDGFCLAQKPDGTIWAWGKNSSGQYGNGTTSIKRFPVKVDSVNQWKRISTSYSHVLAIKVDGSLWGWGENGSGELGLGDYTDRLKAVRIGTRNDWVKVFAGYQRSFALTSDGKLWCWGNNASGALGDGSVTNRNIPAKMDSILKFDTVAAGSFHTIALTKSHKMYAWGKNNNSQIGEPALVNQFSVTTPQKIGTDSTWAMVATGGNHSVALKTDGTIWTWGLNAEGELGDSSLVAKRIAPAKMGTANNWKIISSQLTSSNMAQKTDGSIWGWGRNYNGIFGFEADIIKYRPYKIGTATNWKFVITGGYANYFLNNAGTLFSCGYNGTGGLGQGLSNTYSSIIAQVGCLTTSNQDLLEDENELSVYPNPGNGEFHVSGFRFPATVRLVDMMGRLMSETIVQSEQGAVLFVQEPGMYVVQVLSNVQSRIKTLVVK